MKIEIGVGMWKFFIKDICNILLLSLAHTYNYELTLMVDMSPIGSYVDSLTSKGQIGVLLEEHRGWILRMAFGKNRGATWNRHSF